MFVTPSLLTKIQNAASSLGFDHCAVVPAVIPDRNKEAYAAWLDKGLEAGMSYMARNQELRTEPRQLYSGVQTVLSLGVSYFQGDMPFKPGPSFARVARYAWGRDYHDVIAERLLIFTNQLQEILGAETVLGSSVDTKPVLERALAEAAHLGFVGKNTVLIIPGAAQYHVGSWVFLAELFLSAPLEGDIQPKPVPQGCGQCTRCLDVCPTNAFEGPFHLNAGRCLAYLTIENKGPIPRSLRAAVGDWLFGCDLCQEICPFNARARETRWPEFKETQGVGAWIDLKQVLSITDDAAFKRQFGATPLGRPKRRGLLRNACVAAGNSGDESLGPALGALLEDPEPLLRQHALWALHRLDPMRAREKASALAQDPDADVRDESQWILEGGKENLDARG